MKEHKPWNLLFTCYEPETAPEEEQNIEEETPLIERNGRGKKETSPLHPFDNDDDSKSDTNTKLEGAEPCRFFIFFAINLALVIGMLLVFCFGHYNSKQHIVPIGPTPTATTTQMRNYKIFEMTTVGTYFYSLFCTISSCFIFSKVMYGIQNKCDNLFINEDKGTLKERIDEDKHFVNKAITTLSPFEWWFFIHWVMYIISSFLSLSLLFEAIYEKIQASTIVTQPGIDFFSLELIFLALFAFSNSFFFLYPCIRAAGVTESRNKAIRDMNNSAKNSKQRAFVNYLKEQNFGFRLNILCAHVKFDLNIAYISIFIGLLGVLIKVGTSI